MENKPNPKERAKRYAWIIAANSKEIERLEKELSDLKAHNSQLEIMIKRPLRPGFNNKLNSNEKY